MNLEDRINAKITAAIDEAGKDIVAQIQDELGAIKWPPPPASKPGETPHWRSRRLLEGVTHQPLPNSLIISSAAPYSHRLEVGMDRPILVPALTWGRQILVDKFNQAFH